MIKLEDVFTNKFSKDTVEINARDLDLRNPKGALHLDIASPVFVPAVSKKSVTIKVERILMVTDGSKTTYNVDMEHEFTSVSELKEVLETLGYGKKSLVSRIKTMLKLNKRR